MRHHVTIATAHLSDDAFLQALGTCELPLTLFRHGDHLRLVWLLLHREPFDNALQLVRQQIQRFATFHHVPHIFHETMTRAWVTLLATHCEPDFDAFITANESRLNLTLLHKFWTPECLGSEAARTRWVPPDKGTLLLP